MTYEIKLDVFEGPLDLLLYLIKKNEIDIYDIPIALITEQYLEYIEAMKSLNLDLAGEYLLIASTLIHIKSRMLLPVDEEGDEEDQEDPRSELVRQLLEYQAFKEAALNLERLTLLGRDVFDREAGPDEETDDGDMPIREIGILELVATFRQLIASVKDFESMAIDVEKVSLTERIAQIMDELQRKKEMTFVELLGEMANRTRVIYTFLAILELMKLRLVRTYQAVPYGPIRICLAVGE
ncbi:MAG: segregation/condensation protein A [Deltaproteobacteria bacterium]|nr:segregation/condensation protein A [Deltaproteobacteria bacterium]